MKTIELKTSTQNQSTKILIGSHIIETLPDQLTQFQASSCYLITDSHVAPLYLDQLTRILTTRFDQKNIHTYIVPAGESSKQLSMAELIYQDMASHGVDRASIVINLGGGVVSDLGGFVASTYMRGIPFITISTTLESMVDASFGGKTGVNLGVLKNYVGVFTQPRLVVLDVSTLNTLPKRALIQGYAEVLKHGLIQDKAYFERASTLRWDSFTLEDLMEIIERSVMIKKNIVSQDPYEIGARKLLNFGHTVGHVIESTSFSSDNPLFHGEAVAIGMVAETWISHLMGMIAQKDAETIEQCIASVGLPTRFHFSGQIEDLIHNLLSDKKTTHGTIRFALLHQIGKGVFDKEVSELIIHQGISHVISK